MASLLNIADLAGGYSPTKPVIKDVSFHIEAGEIVGLIGLNGAGKSTTIKHILGLLEPIGGLIQVHGKTMDEDMESYRKAMGYIPETPILYEELTLWEHLRLTAMAYGLEDEAWQKRAEQLIDTFRMKRMTHWFPSHFSKGMRQKVMVMCAFLVEPQLYVVDEPFVGLDPVGIKSLLERMIMMKNNGAGILMSTHILSTAEKHCDRFILLHNGHVSMQGTMEELRQEANMPGADLDALYIEMTKESSV